MIAKIQQDLSRCCSPRLHTLRYWIGVATVRCFNSDIVRDEMKTEPISGIVQSFSYDVQYLTIVLGLILRLIYRIRTLSEQEPFDSTTFSYFSPLLTAAVNAEAPAEGEDDEILEQNALSIDIINFHSGECMIGLSFYLLHC